MTAIKKLDEYPKVRNLQSLLAPTLNPFKINTILRYLERSKRLEIDLDGNIIWIRENNNKPNELSIAEAANISKEFHNYFFTKGKDKADDNVEDES